MNVKKVIFTKDNNVVGVFNEEHAASGTVEYVVGKPMISTSELGEVRFAEYFQGDKTEGFVSLDKNNNVLDVVPMSIIELIKDASTKDITIEEVKEN